jgi:hypothetical protein
MVDSVKEHLSAAVNLCIVQLHGVFHEVGHQGRQSVEE